MEKHRLLDYLKQVHALELDLYTMDETIAELEGQKKELPIKTEFSEPSRGVARKHTEGAGIETSFGIYIACVIGAIPIMWAVCGGWAILIGPFIGIILGAIISGVADSSANQSRQEAEQAKYDDIYDRKLAEYQANVEQEEQRFQKETREVPKFNRTIDEETALIGSSRAGTQEVLNKLYQLNIIYPKYRNLVAVTMFCEYLASGRCEAFEGPHGMYNLYENELRAGIIIGELQQIKGVMRRISSQLGAISGQLSAIRDGQYMLYDAMQRSNESIDRLSSSFANVATSVAEMAGDTAAIRKSAEWTAFNTKAIARRTDAMARIQKFNHAQEQPFYYP